MPFLKASSGEHSDHQTYESNPSEMFLFMGKMALVTLRIGCNCVRGQWCYRKLLCKVAGFQKQSTYPLRSPVTSNRTQMWHGVAIPPLFVLGPIELFQMFAVLKRAKRREKRAVCTCALKVFERRTSKCLETQNAPEWHLFLQKLLQTESFFCESQFVLTNWPQGHF